MRFISFTSILGFCLALMHAFGGSILANEYPDKPIKILVPAAPGGGADFIARTMSNRLTEAFGQNIVIENRAGASGTIAAELMTKSAPNGYTILLAQSTLTVIAPHLYKKLNYDTLKDMVPVTMVAQMPFMMVVHPSIPANNVKELIAYAKAKPGELNFSSSGNGAGSHLAGEMFNGATGLKLTHVPYKGAGPAINAAVAGEVQIAFAPIVAVLPLVKSNRLKAIAVTTMNRSLASPETPTLSESGLAGFDINTWFGLFVPANTPQEIVDRIYREAVKVIKHPEVAERFIREGADPVGNTSAEFGKIVRSEYIKFAKIVKDSGAKID
ncbi:MAG: tripartite tricarboxylate transporter substrate binding protein [Betaproteobacteria bacterium]|jgi:tripartite-type tricarboxylate transporter receptor subunit TctC|nr:tripartite tricarboxylate transporter substrate binding protein [Betaproteobacteria bacterium]